MSDRPTLADDLCVQALDLPPDQRDTFLDRACQGQPTLRQQVNELLRAVGQLDDAFVNAPPPPPRDLTGLVIAGRYTLARRLGRGGMGEVWEAEQAQPVRRRVAVKLIGGGFGGGDILARFAAERQAIALMDHPHIAKLLDAGATDDGDPYFVMEVVHGQSLTVFCDEKKLPLFDRLRLFQQVCAAVQHAHQKGVIHRDLKPSNVLVEEHDGKPVAKVIDFGLAKAAAGLRLTSDTLVTAYGAVMGTPLYMAPEQALPDPADVDTRADVFALGAMLFELLTGTTPLAWETVKDLPVHEIVRLVREREAPAPSQRLTAGRSRATHLRELDWITLKALSKERERRYESAAALSADVQRYLLHEPVQAGPPSRWYRAGKFVRRHRGPVTAAALLLLALLGGFAGTAWGLVQAEERRKEAEQARAREREQKDIAIANEAKAVAAKEEAVTNLKFSQRGNQILGAVLYGLDPKRVSESGRPLQEFIRDNLKAAVRELDEGSIGDPLTVARMRHTLGASLYGLGEYRLAEEVLLLAVEARERLLGRDQPDTLYSLSYLGMSYRETGKLAKGIALLEEVHRGWTARYGPDHPDTLAAVVNLATGYEADWRNDIAEPLLTDSLPRAEKVLGGDHPTTTAMIGSLVAVYRGTGRSKDALPLLEKATADRVRRLGENHPDTLTSQGNLAGVLDEVGQGRKSVELLEDTLQRANTHLGPTHPTTIFLLNNLALHYTSDGRATVATQMLTESNTLLTRRLGVDHPSTLTVISNLGDAYRIAQRPDLAAPLLEQALAGHKARLGGDHPRTIASAGNLASVYAELGKHELAEKMSREVSDKYVARFGPDHPLTLAARNNLGHGLAMAGKGEEAVKVLEDTARRRTDRLGVDHPDTLTSRENLASAWVVQKELPKAIKTLEEIIPPSTKRLGREHPSTQLRLARLGDCYQQVGLVDEAIVLWEEVYRNERPGGYVHNSGGPLLDLYVQQRKKAKAAKLGLELADKARQKHSKESPELAERLESYGHRLVLAGACAEGETLLRECLTISEAKLPDHWLTFHRTSLLGVAVLNQQKPREAEPILIKGFEGLKAREKSLTGRDRVFLFDAIDRLLYLYSVQKKNEEVAKYKAFRAELGGGASKPEKK
jgi:eukaryotic-like serine/threonine-protein kinase